MTHQTRKLFRHRAGTCERDDGGGASSQHLQILRVHRCVAAASLRVTHGCHGRSRPPTLPGRRMRLIGCGAVPPLTTTLEVIMAPTSKVTADASSPHRRALARAANLPPGRGARAYGRAPSAPEAWNCRLPTHSGEVIAIVRTEATAARQLCPDTLVFTMAEVAVAIEALGQAAIEAKRAFPGATVIAVRNRGQRSTGRPISKNRDAKPRPSQAQAPSRRCRPAATRACRRRCPRIRATRGSPSRPATSRRDTRSTWQSSAPPRARRR